MRQPWTGSTIVLSCLWAVTLYFNTAMAGEPNKIAAVPVSSGIDCPFREMPDHCPLTLNDNLTPIDIPGGSHLRGLSLSGNARLTKVGANGSADLAGLHAEWVAQYHMSVGCALLHGYSPTLVEVGPAVVYIASGATAIAHSDNDAARVVNLTDKHRQSVRVVFHRHFIDLEPGQELVLVPTESKDAKAVAVQQDIGWKEMQYAVMDNMIAFVYRASTADMMEKCRIYRQLAQSTCPEDKRIREQIFKTVAALETMYNKKKGPYTVSEPYAYGPGQSKPQEEEASRPPGSV